MLFSALLTLHLVGLALGLGGATIGDITILRALRRGEPQPTDLSALSNTIWLGLAILGISGAGMLLLHPSLYLHNSGFLAKMIVVAMLVANGVLLHRRIPTLRFSSATLLSGAVSTVSWYGALVIAMFKDSVHLSLSAYLGLYLIAVTVVWASYVLMYRRLQGRPDDARGATRGESVCFADLDVVTVIQAPCPTVGSVQLHE